MTASTAPVPETMEGLLRQNGAYRSLCASLEQQMAVLTQKGREYHEAVTTLDSEREANARLTAEIEALNKALDVFRSYGCPACSGDCSAANPPVLYCPMASPSPENGRMGE